MDNSRFRANSASQLQLEFKAAGSPNDIQRQRRDNNKSLMSIQEDSDPSFFSIPAAISQTSLKNKLLYDKDLKNEILMKHSSLRSLKVPVNAAP